MTYTKSMDFYKEPRKKLFKSIFFLKIPIFLHLGRALTIFPISSLMCDRDFISFVRKPERIHCDRMRYNNRIVMSIDDKMFTAEDINVTQAVHKCCKLLYPSFLQHKDKGTLYGATLRESPTKILTWS